MQEITVALAGNPNVGKSTLFNALTGLHQHTGNWPGKTVEIATGSHIKGQKVFHFVDLPGTYALSGGSEEEKIAAEYITSGKADWVVAVCDATALQRSLILALQLKKLTPNLIVCVSLMDEAERMGLLIDGDILSALMEVPVVMMASGRKQSLEKLLDLLSAPPPEFQTRRNYDDCVAIAERIARECVTNTGSKSQLWRLKADRILVSPTWGVGILLALLMTIIYLTVAGANVPSQLLEQLLDYGYDGLQWLFTPLPEWFRGIILDGAYATSARVLSVMLPPMAIFFPLFSFLEDVGYLPRMAFLLDGGMAKCGSCGKQALTMCMGLGCNAVGVTGCRIIQSPKERLLAILTNAMIPCNGRFPTLILLAGLAFGKWAPLAVGVCVIAGAVGAMVTTGVLSKTTYRHTCSHFLMEIPPLRRPRLGTILVRSLLDRTLKIAARALYVAAPAGVILYLLARWNLLQDLSEFLNPVGVFLGMNGVVLLGFVLSLPANELLFPVIFMTLTGMGTLQGVGMEASLQYLGSWSVETLICMMVFTIFHWPCATTILTIRKETSSNKKTGLAVLLPTAVGAGICVILHFLMGYLCG